MPASSKSPLPASDLVFYLNGRRVRLAEVSPTTLLVDYLRSPDVGLTGTKIGCKQGGCGACTVMLSEWDAASGTVRHRSVNSCMRPLASLDGTLVTTVEGTGNVRSEVSPVQHCLAVNNGTQCGYCTPGWVMNMTAAVAQKGDKPGTKKEIEGLFDGNLCRCTGYRPILFGFQKGFASDWNPAVDEQGCMECLVDPAESVNVAKQISIHFPEALKRPPRSVHYRGDGHEWYRPLNLDELLALLKEHANDSVKLVVGNTSVGVYDKYTEDPKVLMDIARLEHLHVKEIGSETLKVGSAVTYSEFLELVDQAIQALKDRGVKDASGLEAARYLAGRTAGTIVRNAASLAGNTMLVVRHNKSGTPFPSDLFTALCMLGATVDVLCPGWEAPQRLEMLQFADKYANSKELQDGCVILCYTIPFRTGDECQTYKCALREVNAHSIVNAGMRAAMDDAKRITDPVIVLGGIDTVAFHATQAETALKGQALTGNVLAAALRALTKDVDAALKRSAARWATVPWEGFTDDYKRHLAQSFLYKFFVHLMEVSGLAVPPEIESAGKRQERPVSRGTQHYDKYPGEYPVNLPFIKLEAFLQTTGEAVYPQDIPLPRRGLEAAFAVSLYPHAKVAFKVPDQNGTATVAEVLAAVQAKFPGVEDIVTGADVPGQKLIGSGGDQPLFCIGSDATLPVNEGLVTAHGEVLCMVLAETDVVAQDAAQFLRTECIAYTPLEPVLFTMEQALAQSPPSIFADQEYWPTHIWKITRPDSDAAWVDPDVDQLPSEVTLNGVPCKVVKGSQQTGAQIHFYMETQTCLAEPGEENQMLLHPSTQSPDSIQQSVVDVLKQADATAGETMLPYTKVDVRIKRVGGGYGGKCDQSCFAAAPAAVAAWKHQRPVRLASARAVDTMVYGHRHPLLANYAVAIAPGADAGDPSRGRLLGWRADFWLDGGFTYDCSFIVSDCVQLRCDSAYYVPNWRTSSDVCRTNKASNTAYRTMGLIQGLIAQEEALEAAAHAIGMLPEDVRGKNLYQEGQPTPFGQQVEDCYLAQVWEFTQAHADFASRLKAVQDFNAQNRWRKRGISMIPVKYASGYNLASLEQAGALVEVYDQDGSILVRHGGVDMGQGVNTKVAQIAALALNVSPGWVRIAEMDTAVVPNPVSTGASTGTAFNGRAVQQACGELRVRLEAFCQTLRETKGEPWCKEQGVNYWDYPQGWRATAANGNTVWLNIVKQANTNRINLSSQTRVAVPGGAESDDMSALTFKPGTNGEAVDHFIGFTFSAACAEVEIDVLTGETTVLRADIVYDMGRSLNPAIDVGQVEGAFVQGVGFVLYEELVYQPDGPLRGALNTLNTWEYKPPAVTSIPLEMNVNLFPYPREIQDDNLLLSSKEVGEPPMCLAITVFFAVKHAIQAARKDCGHDEWFELECPATVQRIREACLVAVDDLVVETP